MAVLTAITAAVGMASTWLAGLTAVELFAVRLISGLAFNALARALAGEPYGPQGGIESQIQQGADLPRRFILGRYATRGSLAYHNQWGGGSNEFYTRATALSDLPVSGLAELWIDGELAEIDWANPDPDGKGFPITSFRKTSSVTRERPVYHPDFPTVITGYETYEDETTTDFGWVRFHDGTQTTADSLLTGSVATEQRPWDATDVGYGVAYAVTTFRMDPEKFQGLPQILFVVDGVQLYDAELNDTGTGDDLPAVQAYAILSGLAWNGQQLYGPQTAAVLGDAEWAAEISKCRAGVPGTAGMSDAELTEAFGSTTVPSRYRSGMEVDVSRPVADVLEDIVSACNGRISHTGTRYRLQVGDPEDAVTTLTDGDILSTSGQRFAPFFPLAETVNAVSATYPEPDEAWETQEAPPLVNTDYEAEEGGRRLPTTVELRAVPYREQVQRLMKSALAEARRARRHSVTLPARYWALEVGDFLDWTSQRNGYVGKRMRLDGLSDLPNGDLVAELTEVDPTDYDWQASSDFTPVTSGSLVDQPLPAWTLSGWSLSPVTQRDGGGSSRRPAILAEWTDPDRARVRGIRWQLRVKATGEGAGSGVIEDVEAEARVLPVAVLPDVEYEGRAKIMARKRASTWTGWVSVTAPDVRLGEGDLDDAVWTRVGSEAISATETLFRNIDSALDFRDGLFDLEVDRLAEFDISARVSAVLETARVEGVVEETRTELTAEIDGVSADLVQNYVTAATHTSALAGLETSLQANIDGVSAALSTNYYTIAEANSAIASAETALQSEIDGVSATLTTSYYTKAETNSAIASAETTLQSQIDGVSADLSVNYFTKAETNSAISAAETALQSEIDGVSATLTTSYYTKAETNSAISAATTTVQTEVDGLSTSVSVVQSSVDGIQGTYGVKINNNGVLAGFGLISDLVDGAPVSDFVVNANKFIVTNYDNSATAVAPFIIDNGVVYIDEARIRTLKATKIKIDGVTLTANASDELVIKANGVKTSNLDDGAVLTDKVGNNQITSSTAFTKSSDETFSNASWTQVLTSGAATWYGSKPLFVTGTMLVEIDMRGVDAARADLFWNYQILIGGVVVHTGPDLRVTNNGEVNVYSVPLSYRGTSVAGSNAVTVEVIKNTTATGDSITLSQSVATVLTGSTLAAFELKK